MESGCSRMSLVTSAVGSGSSRIFALRRRSAIAVFVLLFSLDARAQTQTSTLDGDFLRLLPTADNLFLVLETTQSTLISDRFFGGGLYTGETGRIGGFLGSWSQTLFRVGDVSLSDPTGSGAPLLFPDLMIWERVEIATGLPRADVNASLAITLEPRKPSPTWTRTAQVMTSHFGSASVPAIARLDGSDRVTLLASGPLVPGRLGLVLAGSWTRGSQFNRSESSATTANLGSAFAHLVFTPRDRHEVRVIGWLERSSTPFDLRLAFRQPDATTPQTAGHMQATWAHSGPETTPWRVFAGYTGRRREPGFDSSRSPVFERLVDGPVSALASLSTGNVYQWSLGTRVAPASLGKRHAVEIGLDASGGRSEASGFLSGSAGEVVDSFPARVWRFSSPGSKSIRHELAYAAYVSDRIEIAPRLALDAAVRYDAVSGSAAGAATDISWRAFLPRAAVNWRIAETWQPTIIAGYSGSAYRLTLDLLATGDPAAPTADVFRWNAPAGSTALPLTPGPLVARAGPGTGGDATFTRIDPSLERPRTDELIVGVTLRPSNSVRLGLTGIARRERDFVGLINTGAPTYALSSVFDPGGNLGSTEDDRLVPVYNRVPESFGRDRYLLTNTKQREATFNGVQLSADVTNKRLALRLGATAGRALASAANRGVGPLENDQSLVGELTTDPNAATLARGRVFNDRAYTVKLAAVYLLPKETTIGATARYQDGQPFARLLVFPTLNQGAEAVRAFANGDSRFTYVATLDARVQKHFSTRVDVFIDAYNLTNLANSVEERTTEPPDVRVTTAVQPPRTIQLGLKLSF